jgi:D-arabinose 1-dehydrogenase-like Zn-dependent alcohol dehydrogenase
VGTFAVQLARWCGAHVTATASADNAGFVRQLGADEVIDYRKEQFEDKVRDVDVALDTIGGETLERSWKVLRRGGALMSLASAVSADTASRMVSEAHSSSWSRVVEAVLPLTLTREAHVRGMRGHSRGKLVLQVRDDAA